jgi:hypothetical protein
MMAAYVSPKKRRATAMESTREVTEKDVKLEMDIPVEELEEKIAPGLNLNHNEKLLTDTDPAELTVQLELDVEELEEKTAPGINLHNHNETLVRE